MKKLIAKTIEGKEYFHTKNNTFFCSGNAQKIADILNNNKYLLKQDCEKWHVYDYDFMQDDYTDQRIYINSKGLVKAAMI